MFHSGDLNSGISLAIQHQKLVACFVRQDDDYWSQIWEDHWLKNGREHAEDASEGPTVGDMVNEKAVLLRLDFGSKEAGFLGAFCKIEKAPTLVIIDNGRVLEKLEGGVGQDEWLERVLKAVGLLQGEEAGQDDDGQAEDDEDEGPGSQAYADRASSTPTEPAAEEQRSQPTNPAAAAAETPSQSSTPPQPQSQTIDTLFPARAARLEAEKTHRDAAEKAARLARQAARRKEAEEAAEAAAQHSSRGGGKGKQRATTEENEKQRARDAWIYQQKQRKDEAKQERERILRQIEADKLERKTRAQRAKEAESEAGAGASEPVPASSLASARRSAGAGGACSLQIRLFDGSSIRGKFPVESTLAKAVRDWVKETSPPGTGGADVPYSFRQILAPRPSRSIEVSEEHRSLGDLELVPNATLVLVPVAGYTDAYASSSSSGGILGYGYSLVNGVWSRLPQVSYYLPSFSRLYMGGTGDARKAGNVEGARMAGAGVTPAAEEGSQVEGRRTHTLADQRAEEERERKKRTEFYNGNSLGFEGRKGDDDGDGEGK